jgi:hypothetical protein
MSQTTLRIGSPVRNETWGLAVDVLTHPTEHILLRYPHDEGSTAKSSEVVCRVPYQSDPARLAELTGMPAGVAKMLHIQLEAKRHSPKAVIADTIGYRPVR